ncbi:MAG: hypothetical protein F9K49_08160 [Caedimonadaceae bacterium]|nr:MAG: hypothetical protein F9K49_08160 [Caedimonadaceae bacterium]
MLKETKQPSRALIKAAAVAYGHCTYITPYTCQFFDKELIPHLRSGKITYEDLRERFWDFKFGQIRSTQEVNTDKVIQMANGQQLTVQYHLNFPVYFNRLLGKFEGDRLFIGGGEKCSCENPTKRHPKSLFYHLDIDNACLPDMVCHAGYLEHLHTLPTERFSFIWIEHTPLGEIGDERVLQQYFRIAKPGALFVYQTGFLLGGQYDSKAKRSLKNVQRMFQKYKASILEEYEGKTKREGEMKKYLQFIAQFPYKKDPSLPLECEGPIFKDRLENYRAANTLEQLIELSIAKILSNQAEIKLIIPLEELHLLIEESNAKGDSNR